MATDGGGSAEARAITWYIEAWARRHAEHLAAAGRAELARESRAVADAIIREGYPRPALGPG